MRYATFITLLCVLLAFQYLPAQAPDTLWTKTYGGSDEDWSYSVQQTTDSGYIIVGYTYSYGIGNQDIWLIKTDASGDTLWTKTFGGGYIDYGRSVQQTADGGYILVGATESFGVSYSDIWLIKTNNSGDTLWTKTFGREYADRGYSVQQTTDGGFIITGYTESFGKGGDIWLIKTDASGDTLWTRMFGGEHMDRGYSVQQTADGGYVITGSMSLYYSFDCDVCLIKTDASGDTLWTRTYSGSEPDGGFSVQQTTDGGYIIIGYTYSFSAGCEAWLIKTDTFGDTLWTRTFGEGRASAKSVQQTSDGGYIITGYKRPPGGTTGDLWLIKTDASGDTLWTKTFGGTRYDNGNAVQQTTDGGYIIVGVTDSFGAGWYDVWLIKTTPDPLFSINERPVIITQYSLSQNYPNPFNPSTTIEFDLPKTTEVTLKVFNILGEEVATLVSSKLSTGSYSYNWDASNFASGVYLYRLQAGDYVETKKMILMR